MVRLKDLYEFEARGNIEFRGTPNAVRTCKSVAVGRT